MVCHILTVNVEWVLSSAGSPRTSLLSLWSYSIPLTTCGPLQKVQSNIHCAVGWPLKRHYTEVAVNSAAEKSRLK